MNRLRQTEEANPSRSTIVWSERLATPAESGADQELRPWIKRQLRRIDSVATPALFGTTVSWITGLLLMQSIYLPVGSWLPSVTTLLQAFTVTLTVAVPLAYGSKRWHGWYAALATLIGMSLASAYSFGANRATRYPWPTDENMTLYFAKQNFWILALAVLLTGFLWLPVVMAVYHSRKTLAERLKEEQLHA